MTFTIPWIDNCDIMHNPSIKLQHTSCNMILILLALSKIKEGDGKVSRLYLLRIP